MDKIEAIYIVESYLDKYRNTNYVELVQKVDEQETFDGKSANGEEYRIEIDFMFDDEEEKNLRVFGMISYNFWTDFSPVSSDFIISPNEIFIDE